MAVTLISQILAEKLLRDPRFIAAMPEFAALERRTRTKPAAPKCKSCRKRVTSNDGLLGEFGSTVLRLPPDRLAKFKQVAGVDQVQYQGFDVRTGKFESRIL